MSEIEASDTSAVPPQQSAIMIRITDGKNPRGIPTARFIVREIYIKYQIIFKSVNFEI